MGIYLDENSVEFLGLTIVPIETTDMEDAFIERKITNYVNSTVSRIGNYAFMGASIETIDCPAVISIGALAFSYCPHLIQLSFPRCTTIGDGAFSSCYSLKKVYLPNYSSSALYNLFTFCSQLTDITINFSAVTYISGTFSYCRSLSQVTSFPNVTSIGGYTFYFCSSLQKVSFPQVTFIGGYAFMGCSRLSQVSFPQVTSMGGYAFSGCYSLSQVSFPKLSMSIGSYAFASCYNLISLNLSGITSIPTLSGSSTFYSTPIGGYSTSAGQYGSVYVPSSLYNSFLTATNWSLISSRIVSI